MVSQNDDFAAWMVRCQYNGYGADARSSQY